MPEAVELKVRIEFVSYLEWKAALELTNKIVREIEGIKIPGIREISVVRKCFGSEIES